MKTYTLTVKPTPSILAFPWEAARLDGKEITLEMQCHTMGKVNRNRLMRRVMPELYIRFGALCKIGGFTCGEPKEKR